MMEKKLNIELKSCPFCGKTKTVKFQNMSGIDYTGKAIPLYKVYCSYLDSGCGVSTRPYGSKKQAAEAWNSRS